MKLKAFNTTASALALAGAIAFIPAAAFAGSADASSESTGQTQADAGAQGSEIVVTAQRREEKSRDVPITITTLNQDQLATANVVSLADTAKLTPGLRFDTAGPDMQATIRGVGTAISTSGGGPNVGIYVDGFFQSNPYVTDFDLLQVKDIEVLKGPQGTLFGRNTTGGAILVNTAEPSTTTAAEFKASYGSFNALTLQAYATTALTKDIAFDIQGMYRSGDGYNTNIVNGDNKVGKYDNWSIRTGLKWQVNDDISVLLRYYHAETNDPTAMDVNAFVDTTGGAGFFSQVSPAGQAIYGRSSSAGLPLIQLAPAIGGYAPTPGSYATAPGQVALAAPVSFHTRSDAVQGTIKADLGFANLTSYTQYRFDRDPYFGDLDATTLNLFHILVDVYDKTFSQEFLLNSKAGSRLQWTVGLNYFENVDNWGVSAEGNSVYSPGAYIPFGGSSTNTQSLAAFADATYEVLPDKLFLTLGGRFSHDVVADAFFIANPFTQYTGYTLADGSPATCGINVPACPPGSIIPVPSLTENSFTPRVVLRYKPDNVSSVYASYARGYKAGILNVGGSSLVPVAPETNDAFELGYKYETRRFGFDLAGFLYNYKNLQVSSYQAGAAQIRNAATARIYGIDAQAHYKLDEHFDLNAGATWLHARYTSFTNAPYYSYCDPTVAYGNAMYCASGTGSIVETTTNASGYHMQRAPDFSGNIGASYGFNLAQGRTTLSGNLYYTSSFYFDPEQQFKQNGYATLSLRAQWVDPSKRYTVAVYGDNVTDKRYLTQVLFTTLGTGATWNAPATWGVSFDMKY